MRLFIGPHFFVGIVFAFQDSTRLTSLSVAAFGKNATATHHPHESGRQKTHPKTRRHGRHHGEAYRLNVSQSLNRPASQEVSNGSAANSSFAMRLFARNLVPSSARGEASGLSWFLLIFGLLALPVLAAILIAVTINDNDGGIESDGYSTHDNRLGMKSASRPRRHRPVPLPQREVPPVRESPKFGRGGSQERKEASDNRNLENDQLVASAPGTASTASAAIA